MKKPKVVVYLHTHATPDSWINVRRWIKSGIRVGGTCIHISNILIENAPKQEFLLPHFQLLADPSYPHVTADAVLEKIGKNYDAYKREGLRTLENCGLNIEMEDCPFSRGEVASLIDAKWLRTQECLERLSFEEFEECLLEATTTLCECIKTRDREIATQIAVMEGNTLAIMGWVHISLPDALRRLDIEHYCKEYGTHGLHAHMLRDVVMGNRPSDKKIIVLDMIGRLAANHYYFKGDKGALYDSDEEKKSVEIERYVEKKLGYPNIRKAYSGIQKLYAFLEKKDKLMKRPILELKENQRRTRLRFYLKEWLEHLSQGKV